MLFLLNAWFWIAFHFLYSPLPILHPRSPVVQFTFGSSVELNLPTSASYFQGSEDLGRLLDEMEALLDGDFELSITEGEERLSQTKDRHTKLAMTDL